MTQIELQTMESIKRAAWKYTEVGYWEQLRHQAALAAMPQCISVVHQIVASGKRDGNDICEFTAKLALRYADALVEALKDER